MLLFLPCFACASDDVSVSLSLFRWWSKRPLIERREIDVWMSRLNGDFSVGFEREVGGFNGGEVAEFRWQELSKFQWTSTQPPSEFPNISSENRPSIPPHLPSITTASIFLTLLLSTSSPIQRASVPLYTFATFRSLFVIIAVECGTTSPRKEPLRSLNFGDLRLEAEFSNSLHDHRLFLFVLRHAMQLKTD
jgi:hypothetical protein